MAVMRWPSPSVNRCLGDERRISECGDRNDIHLMHERYASEEKRMRMLGAVSRPSRRR